MTPDAHETTAREPYSPQMDSIVREVAAAHGLTVAEIESHSRRLPALRARDEAFAKCYDAGLGSWPEVAMHFDARDHSSALRGARRYRERSA